MVAAAGFLGIAKNRDRALGRGVVIAALAEIDAPVADLAQFHRLLLEELGLAGQRFRLLAFGMFFFIPMALVVINLISQRSKVFKQVYDKLAGTDKPQTAGFVPHWFMMAAMAVLLICLISFIVTIVASLKLGK